MPIPDRLDDRWAERLSSLCAGLRRAPAEERDRFLTELWLLLNVRLLRHLQAQARRYGWIEPEDLRDLGSEKTLEMLRGIDSGSWKPEESDVGAVVRYVATVARNGLADLFRGRGRERQLVERVLTDRSAPPPSPDAPAVADGFAIALVECVAALAPRSRNAWILRAFYDMTSRDIAAHPSVTATRGNVDVILSRARSGLTECLDRAGIAHLDMGPGCYAAIWNRFLREGWVREESM